MRPHSARSSLGLVFVASSARRSSFDRIESPVSFALRLSTAIECVRCVEIRIRSDRDLSNESDLYDSPYRRLRPPLSSLLETDEVTVVTRRWVTTLESEVERAQRA